MWKDMSYIWALILAAINIKNNIMSTRISHYLYRYRHYRQISRYILYSNVIFFIMNWAAYMGNRHSKKI